VGAGEGEDFVQKVTEFYRRAVEAMRPPTGFKGGVREGSTL
jgi:hypothetical protein